MIFDREDHRAAFPRCHPDIIKLADDFDAFSTASGLPEPEVSDLTRTEDEQGETYLKTWKREMTAIQKKKSPSIAERSWLDKMLKLSDDEMRALGRKKPSWHVWFCGVDFRTRIYTKAQLEVVVAWFKKRCRAGEWELKTELHGTGPHIHCGRRDETWRKRFTKLEVTRNV